MQRKALRYDSAGDQHYDYISAWIKATRGSDPDASLYYLAVMLEGGEDPRFIARRMVILASEDVGNADPRRSRWPSPPPTPSSTSGCPSASSPSPRPRSTSSLAPKSERRRSARSARRRGHVREHGAEPPPDHLRSAAYPGAAQLGRGLGYDYPHGHPGHVSEQELMPEGLEDERFYEPGRRRGGAARAPRGDPPGSRPLTSDVRSQEAVSLTGNRACRRVNLKAGSDDRVFDPGALLSRTYELPAGPARTPALRAAFRRAPGSARSLLAARRSSRPSSSSTAWCGYDPQRRARDLAPPRRWTATELIVRRGRDRPSRRRRRRHAGRRTRRAGRRAGRPARRPRSWAAPGRTRAAWRRRRARCRTPRTVWHRGRPSEARTTASQRACHVDRRSGRCSTTLDAGRPKRRPGHRPRCPVFVRRQRAQV